MKEEEKISQQASEKQEPEKPDTVAIEVSQPEEVTKPESEQATPAPAESGNNVYPCCCPSKPSSYFNFFSIFYIVLTSVSIIREISPLMKEPSTTNVMNILISAAFLTWAVIVYISFVRTNEYGNTLSYVFALTILILQLVRTLGILIVSVFLLIIGTAFLSIIPEEIEEMATTYHTLFVVFLVLFAALAAYFFYLTYLYFNVVREKKDLNEEAEKKAGEEKAEEEVKADQTEVELEKNDLKEELA